MLDVMSFLIKSDADPRLVYHTVQSIFNAYSEPHRHYHNVDHLMDCLNKLKLVKHLCVFPEKCALALAYHDYIYTILPLKSNNSVQMSANIAKIQLNSMGICSKYIEDIIINTDHFSRELFMELSLRNKQENDPIIKDIRVVVDIDMSILGSSQDTFNRYERDIRKEYNFLSDSSYYPVRIDFIDRMIKKSQIFYTDHFREKYEEKARINLKNLKEKLLNRSTK